MATDGRSDAYSDAFYDAYGSGSERSAAAVLDVLRLARSGPVATGRRHRLWARRVAARLPGAEGRPRRSASTARGMQPRSIPTVPVEFRSCDLAEASSAGLASLVGAERFDLAISVEALEHLPPAAGARVIEALVSCSHRGALLGGDPRSGRAGASERAVAVALGGRVRQARLRRPTTSFARSSGNGPTSSPGTARTSSCTRPRPPDRGSAGAGRVHRPRAPGGVRAPASELSGLGAGAGGARRSRAGGCRGLVAGSKADDPRDVMDGRRARRGGPRARRSSGARRDEPRRGRARPCPSRP